MPKSSTQNSPGRPQGINHLVLNVRDIEESHHFWTEVVGYVQVGELKKSETYPDPPKMRFYSGIYDGKLDHHDLALVENPDLPEPPTEWSGFGMPMAIGHIAITFPTHEGWLSRLRHVQEMGVKFNRRADHGMTHSLYINDPNGYGVELIYELPREHWEGDIEGALNYIRNLPNEGEEALEDDLENAPVFKGAAE